MEKLGTNGLNRKYWLCFFVLFFITLSGVYASAFLTGKTLLISGDCRVQSYQALLFYSRWLKTVFHNLFVRHVWEIPTYSFGIGYGSNIVTPLHLQSIGDPLLFFSVFVPERLIQRFYSVCLVTRYCLAGITFSLYCFYVKKRNIMAVLSGAMLYMFSSYTLGADSAHPWFTWGLVYFPLMLLGCERILREKKHGLFILSVGLAGLTNFYYFYVVTILTVLYVLCRLVFTERRSGKETLLLILRFLGDGCIGCLIAGPTLFPNLMHSLSDFRLTRDYFYRPLYSLSYYASFPGDLLIIRELGDWSYVGTSFLAVLVLVFLLISKKRYRIFKAAGAGMLIMILIPFFGRALNAFTYVNNRWVFAYVLFVCVLCAEVWEDFLAMTRREVLSCGAVLLGYLVVLVFLEHGAEAWVKRNLAGAFLLMGLTLLIVFFREELSGPLKLKGQGMSLALLVLSVLGVVMNAWFYLAPSQRNYVKHYTDRETDLYAMTMESNIAGVGEADPGDDFYRVSGEALGRDNYGLGCGISSTQFYWSMTNPLILQFFSETGNSIDAPHVYRTLDDSTILNELASVKYTLPAEESGEIPYGYEKAGETKDGGLIYRNRDPLSLGYTYDSVFPKSRYLALSTMQRREAFLESAVVEDEKIGKGQLSFFPEKEPEFTEQVIPFTVTCEETVSFNGTSFTVREGGGKAFLSFEGMPECETCFRIDGLSYGPLRPEDDAFPGWLSAKDPGKLKIRVRFFDGDTEKSEHTLYTASRTAKYQTGFQDAAVNSGYFEKALNRVELRFPSKGIYGFSELEMVCQPMERYKSQVARMKQAVLTDVDLHLDSLSFTTSRITGRIGADRPRLLVLSIPYENGWKAFVDGEETELLQANTMFMALGLGAGDHEIELKFHTPGMSSGVLAWLVGMLLFALTVLWRRRNEE